MVFSVWFFGKSDHGANFLSSEGYKTDVEAIAAAVKKMDEVASAYYLYDSLWAEDDEAWLDALEQAPSEWREKWGIEEDEVDRVSPNLWIEELADLVQVCEGDLKAGYGRKAVKEWHAVYDSDGDFNGWNVAA